MFFKKIKKGGLYSQMTKVINRFTKHITVISLAILDKAKNITKKKNHSIGALGDFKKDFIALKSGTAHRRIRQSEKPESMKDDPFSFHIGKYEITAKKGGSTETRRAIAFSVNFFISIYFSPLLSSFFIAATFSPTASFEYCGSELCINISYSIST